MQIIELTDIGSVIIRKSARAKRVIIKIDHANQPTVVIPKYIPYAVGVNFAKRNRKWIFEHIKQEPEAVFQSNTKIGRNHEIIFKPVDQLSVKSRVHNSKIIITHPIGSVATEKSVQKEAIKAATRAIKREAEEILPSLLHSIARKFNYKYRSVNVKNMRSRWGSCSSAGVINLNIWLVQLPDELIEYVCCHELAHLNHPHHQKLFWNELSNMLPNYKMLRKKLKTYSPSLSYIS
jgi:predicted metal-dependent hydrolase